MKPTDPNRNELWRRLIHGEALDGLGFHTIDGRADLSGIQLPEPEVLRRFQFDRTGLAAVASTTPEIRDIEWRNLDFSQARLRGLRLHQCRISDCSFNSSDLREWRVWATSFRNCSFRGADLRKSLLGGVEGGERCAYVGVDFTEADLRATTYKAAAFERCEFRNTRLEKIDFQSSTFTDCVFDGEMRDVLFYSRGYEGEEFPENEMINVDFSGAKLHHVAFRGLTLDRVKLPEDEDHILIRNPNATLERLAAVLQQRGDSTSTKLAAFLNIGKKWMPKDQAQKVVNASDVSETLGVEALELLRTLVRATPQTD